MKYWLVIIKYFFIRLWYRMTGNKKILRMQVNPPNWFIPPGHIVRDANGKEALHLGNGWLKEIKK
jgi:hypothetical protein